MSAKIARPTRQHSLIRLTTLALVLNQVWPAMAAEPSQAPLVNRPEGKPHPNLMLTLDDSGSMTHQYLPEGAATVNGVTVTFPPDTRIYMHPSEIKKNIWTARPTSDGSMAYDTRIVTAVPKTLESTYLTTTAARLNQYQLRSPQVNTIYYNPAVKYEPWKGIDANGQSYDFNAPDPTKANLDPLALDPQYTKIYPAGWVDLTQVNLTETKDFSNVFWYPQASALNPTAKTLNYNPALVYLLKEGEDPTNVNSYEYYNLNSGVAVTYPKAYGARTDCAVTEATTATGASSTTCDAKAELQNFTNWFVFYRSRLLMAQGTLPESLGAMSNKFRAGWGTLHAGIEFANEIPSDYLRVGKAGDTSYYYNVDGVKSKTVQHGVREWAGKHKYDFTKWIRTFKTYGGTPTRQAVESVQDYFKRTDAFSPWSSDMVNGSDKSKHLSCRRAYNMVLTDGYYTALAANTDVAINRNVDELGSPIDKLKYPFSDGAKNTLADYVMDSWLNDLREDLANDVPAVEVKPKDTTLDAQLLAKVKSDPATHQHLTYFFMGMGMTGKLASKEVLSSTSAYDAALLRLAKCGSGGDCWNDIDPETALPADRVDDVWHAAINSRGRYFSVNDSHELKTAIASVMEQTSAPLKEAGLATASTALKNGNVKFVPEYLPYAWTGNVRAYSLDADGKVEKEIWDASQQLPDAASRNIHTWNGTSGVPLQTGNSFGTEASKVLTKDMIDFLRGVTTIKGLRERQEKALLPDFINSIPLFVQGGTTITYTGKTGSGSYSESKAKRSDGLLFVGGNGGMLHGFSTTTGKEEFAFLPSTAVPNLPALTQPNYGSPENYHRYFVDGQLVEADVDLTEGNWQNIVVGTLGAGGKAMFALQLGTNSVKDKLNETAVMWERTHPDMGYITTTPQVGKLPDGSWKVFSGNGVDSSNGKPTLLVIDVDKNKPIQSIELPVPASTGTSAGLGGVALARDASTGRVTAVYAGDTLGRLWRFDVNADSSITVAYGGNPLVTASDLSGAAQPILATPLIYAHPLGGQLIMFNTGRLLYEDDSKDTQLQSAYGIWDKVSAGKSTASESAPAISRANLQAQEIKSGQDFTQADGSKRTFFDLSSNTITWASSTQSTGKMGWVLDLAVPEGSDGTRTYPKAIYDPQRFGRSVLISAITPGSKEESCTESKAKGYGFLVKALTGAQSIVASVDVNGDGQVTSKGDSTQSGFTFDGGPQTILTGGKDTPTPTSEPGGCEKGNAQNARNGIAIRDCGSSRIKDRVWRQLLNPPHP